MNDEIISKSNAGSNIPLVDEDAINVDGGASRLVTSWITSKGLTNAEEDTYSRNVQSFTTFRASGLPAIARRDLPMPDDGKMHNHRRESSQQRYARQSSASKTNRSEEIEGASSYFENAVIKYQKLKLRPKRQISRERQQQQQQQSNYSSSDESVARNKSKSTSSIDTQSVNNILDEYEDLNYRRSSDLSDVGNISVTNFEAIMMDQQKRQQVKSKQVKSSAKIQTKSIPTREKIQSVLKVNQQTQVRQRSRDRQKDSNKGYQQDTCSISPPVTMDAIESSRSKMPEILLRRGEVQKRVDEWLNQAHSQNFPAIPREKPLTRSNSSAEKSQRRYRGQDSRSRTSVDEAKDKLNGGTSSSYDDLTRVNRRLERVRPEKVNVGVNTSKGTYKEYLARSKQQDYGFSAQSNIASAKSGDSNLASRIPQRGLLGSSFKSRRAEANLEEKPTASSRIMNLAKSESDHRTTINSNSKMIEMSIGTTSMATAMTTTSSIISYRRPSLKRSGNRVDENCATAAAAHSLVKEEMDPLCEPGPTKGLPLLGGSFSDQGEPISPNKDGESRRPAATASRLTPQPGAADKTVEATCKSTEVSARCAANYSRDSSSRIASSAESNCVAIESRRRRLQFCSDVRREPKSIDQSRQEQSIYGSAVSARVRALQGQVESRTPRTRCQQIAGASMEVRRPLVLPRKDLGVSSQDAGSQDRANVSISAPSSSFKPNNRVYTTINDSQQQPNEQNATRSKIAVCENVPSVRITRYASPDHVERIYERSLQPQVIHADDLESILRPSLQASPYGEKAGVSKDRESAVKETSLTLEDETFDKTGELRHEHLEIIKEDDRKSENLVGRYPEIGLKQCLKVQKNLPNGKSKESADRRKENPIYVKWNPQQQVVYNEPARTFATFQSASPCQNNVQSNVRSRSPEMKESRGHEEIRQDPDESTILQDLVGVYEKASREDQDQLTIHSRENSSLSTATIPVDELESKKDSKLKAEEESSRNKLQYSEKLQDRIVEEMTKNADERGGAVVNEVLVKNLQFEQDLPENPVEQTRPDHVVQQVNFHNILCDDYENEKLKNKKMYMTKEEMEHQRLMDMLKRGNFETLKTLVNMRRAKASGKSSRKVHEVKIQITSARASRDSRTRTFDESKQAWTLLHLKVYEDLLTSIRNKSDHGGSRIRGRKSERAKERAVRFMIRPSWEPSIRYAVHSTL
ncbi:PREDICTED: uncharacterized protein LOC108776364 [Cyphomyrmex costatus]|uniref:uncharacterized protein LOC108776364 n=1 Tax=Cyphomyrmex costatus TaxID=456900 RepID=UPI0008521D77|nr:PREDICTED: uncharacterized protein LOC108776364 [Cyphomyrmex costatus]